MVLLFVLKSYGQGLNEALIKKDLQGFWVLTADPNFTFVFQGDTILEYHIGENEVDIGRYEITMEGCDNQEVFGNKAVYYLVQESDPDDPGLCVPIEYINDTHLYLRISKDRLVELDKKIL